LYLYLQTVCILEAIFSPTIYSLSVEVSKTVGTIFIKYLIMFIMSATGLLRKERKGEGLSNSLKGKFLILQERRE